MDLGRLRKEYAHGGLRRKNLNADPFVQFEVWFQESVKAKLPEANAMSLATVSADAQPSIRTVLLKYFDDKGFVFFTNYESKKSRDIRNNPNVALLFLWIPLNRQVQITGNVSKISTAESIQYFVTRPRGSQLGAWCSQQSSTISSRTLLIAKLEEMKRKFTDKRVPLPSFWGGYRVAPQTFEFWQGRSNRLHDRFLYSRQTDGSWCIERLAP